MRRSISHRFDYPYPRWQVWRAMTEPTALASWLMPNNFAPVVGHRFCLRTDPGPGFDGRIACEVLELDEPNQMTWSWTSGPVDTIVTFELTEDETESTVLGFTQSGFRGVRGKTAKLLLDPAIKRTYRHLLPAYLQQMPPDVDAPLPTFTHTRKTQPARMNVLEV
ncbi:MAG: SRPBCC domain-containing protein [Actinomycetota bacterium]|nr:SRPBCC domain-containing protein [Actinomycetota bacterium]